MDSPRSETSRYRMHCGKPRTISWKVTGPRKAKVTGGFNSCFCVFTKHSFPFYLETTFSLNYKKEIEAFLFVKAHRFVLLFEFNSNFNAIHTNFNVRQRNPFNSLYVQRNVMSSVTSNPCSFSTSHIAFTYQSFK